MLDRVMIELISYLKYEIDRERSPCHVPYKIGIVRDHVPNF